MRANSEPEAARALQHARCCPHASATPSPVPPGFTSRFQLAAMQKMATVSVYTDVIQTLFDQHRPLRAAPSRSAVLPCPSAPRGILSRQLPIPPAGAGSASAAAFRWERDVTATLFDITQPRKP